MDLFLVAGILVGFGVLLVIVAPIVGKLAGTDKDKDSEELPFKLKNYFFSKSEREFFRILEQQLDHTRFAVFPKVRLADFVETDDHGEGRWGSWNKIKAKHVDFLIFDTQKSKIAIAIELDGKSHNGERARKNDNFKNKLYPTLDLELVRVKTGSDFATEITSILGKL